MTTATSTAPWRTQKAVHRQYDRDWLLVFGAHGECLAWVNKWSDEPQEAEANAKLIAAAPDLLRACELFQKWMLCGQPYPFSDSAILEIVGRAIAKAQPQETRKGQG